MSKFGHGNVPKNVRSTVLEGITKFNIKSIVNDEGYVHAYFLEFSWLII